MEMNGITLDLGYSGYVTFEILWSDHNNVQHKEYVKIAVRETKPAALDVHRFEYLEKETKYVEQKTS